MNTRNRDIIAGVVTRLRVGRSAVRIPAGPSNVSPL